MSQPANSNSTVMCILSYLGILAFIPYFTQKDNAFINWHSRQGLFITAIAIVISIGLSFLSMMPMVGWLASIASLLFSLGFLGLCVFCMIQACNGKKWPVPGMAGLLDKSST